MWMVGRLVAFIVVVTLAGGAVPASARVVDVDAAPAYRTPTPAYRAPTPAYRAPTPAYRAPTPAYRAPNVAYRWPLDGAPVVARRFAPPPEPWLPGHRGVDLAAQAGATVRAAGEGVVYFAGVVAGRGVVSVEHPGGLRTTYEPVEATVRAGTRVDGGTPLGRLAAGHPGCPAAACLHWGLRRGEVYLDPLGLIGMARVRLLPVHPVEKGR